jgi:hypothetical protein
MMMMIMMGTRVLVLGGVMVIMTMTQDSNTDDG